MGMIKKKNVVRATDGGVKYICDVCSIDITATVRIHCAEPTCKDYDLCVPCFGDGKCSRDHDPPTHSYQVVEQHSVPIFTEDWGADEEMLLLEGAETYGLGSWADIADHIGGFRSKDEVCDHYSDTFVHSSHFPLPERASPQDRRLVEEWPRDRFQERKKRRIEEKREETKNAPAAEPKQKPTSSVPSNHEVQGYMPGRLEFETEFFNEAEEAVQHMQFEPDEGVLRDGELDSEMILKMTVMKIYNTRLTSRVDRKRFIFEHQLLEYRRNIAAEKKRTKEERDLYNKAKPLARVMNKGDFDTFTTDLEYELQLRQAISQLQEWRQMQVSDLKSGERYELEKAQRSARQAAQSSYERFATARPPKAAANETNPAVTSLTSTELELRPPGGLQTPPLSTTGPPDSSSKENKPQINGHVNGDIPPVPTPLPQRPKFNMQPLANTTPARLNNDTAPDSHLMSSDERELCSILGIKPRAYTAIKESLLREAARQGGSMKKKAAKEVCKVDTAKGGKIFDFFVHSGWIAKA